MLGRIIVLVIFFYYYKDIYQYMISNNLLTIEGITKKCSKSFNKVDRMINNNALNMSLNKLKTIDTLVYKEVKKKIKSVDKIYHNIIMHKSISIKNDYDTIKYFRKDILNKISSITISEGFNDSLNYILDNIDKYIMKILHKILDLQKNGTYNTEWFEDTTINEDGKIGVESNDDYFNPNFNVF
tara:strand:+ start:76 stop:627 length:552 start_codon:yes stop_codon:yes gene_type:complete